MQPCFSTRSLVQKAKNLKEDLIFLPPSYFPPSGWQHLTKSFLTQLFLSLIKSTLPSHIPLFLTVTDGGLHQFIAFTYFSAHPLNDTHSYLLTLHPSLLPHLPQTPAFHSSSALYTNGFLFSSILCNPPPFSLCVPLLLLSISRC